MANLIGGDVMGILRPPVAPVLTRLGQTSFDFIGDSRVAQVFTDLTTGSPYPLSGIVKSGHWFNVANSLLGGRMKIAYNGGISSARAEQYLVNLPRALASSAGWTLFHGVVNDAAQCPTTGDTGATVWLKIKKAALAALAVGKKVIIVGEPGATNLTSGAEQAVVYQYNELAREFCEITNNAYYFNLPAAVVDPVNSNATTIAFFSGYSADGTHLGQFGSWYAGNAFADFISQLIPALSSSIFTPDEVNGNGGLQQIANPLFLTATGGTSNAGITGSTPSGYTTSRSGSATATISVASDANGYGNAVTLACTFTAQGETISINNGTTLGNYTIPGDIVESGVTYSVAAGSVNLAAAYLGSNFGGTSNPTSDGYPLTGTGSTVALPSVAMNNMFLKSIPFPLPSGTSWAFWDFHLLAAGAGSCTVTISRPYMRRRLAA